MIIPQRPYTLPIIFSVFGRLLCVCLVGICTPIETFAQSNQVPTKHILVVHGLPVDALSEFSLNYQKYMLDVLDDMGYRLTFEKMVMNGDPKHISTQVSESVSRKKPDLLVALSSVGLQGVLESPNTAEIPVVFTYVSDPIALGVIPAWDTVSESNVTGVGFAPEFQSKVQMLESILEGREITQPLRIAYLVSSYPSALAELETVKSMMASGFKNFTLTPIKFDGTQATATGEQMHQSVLKSLAEAETVFNALWVASGPIASKTSWTTELSRLAGLPIIYGYSVEQVRIGAAFGMHSTPELMAQEVTTRSVQILSGIKANDIPVQRPSDLLSPVNLTTLLGLGIIPASYILELAGEEIYQ